MRAMLGMARIESQQNRVNELSIVVILASYSYGSRCYFRLRDPQVLSRVRDLRYLRCGNGKR